MPSLIDCALEHATQTRRVVLGRGILPGVHKLVGELTQYHNLAIIADSNTFRAAGRRVLENFKCGRRSIATGIIFDDPDLSAEIGFAEQIEASLRDSEAIPIAVGSGTINDLVKLASHRL